MKVYVTSVHTLVLFKASNWRKWCSLCPQEGSLIIFGYPHIQLFLVVGEKMVHYKYGRNAKKSTKVTRE